MQSGWQIFLYKSFQTQSGRAALNRNVRCECQPDWVSLLTKQISLIRRRFVHDLYLWIWILMGKLTFDLCSKHFDAIFLCAGYHRTFVNHSSLFRGKNSYKHFKEINSYSYNVLHHFLSIQHKLKKTLNL